MKSNLKCAFIGMGNMGQKHLAKYLELKDLEIVAVCDTNKERAIVAEKIRVSFYGDYLEMLEKEKPDLVSVCVPTELHYEIGKHCIQRGVHVLLEKPICYKVDTAEKLLSLAKEREISLLVGHTERFNPAVIRAKEILDNGQIGGISEISAKRFGKTPARGEKNNVAIDLAIHDIDIINYLLDGLPKKIEIKKQKNNNEDLIEFLLTYSSSVARVKAAWTEKENVRELKVVGAYGGFVLDYKNQKIKLQPRCHSEVPASTARRVEESLIFESEREEKIIEKDSLKGQIEHFLDSVRNEKLLNSEFALDALKVATYEKEEAGL